MAGGLAGTPQLRHQGRQTMAAVVPAAFDAGGGRVAEESKLPRQGGQARRGGQMRGLQCSGSCRNQEDLNGDRLGLFCRTEAGER